ncbi:NFACT family protein [Paenactinomyces guangxiensis]|uniref:Rqc2 homolog RqcH n=1 Tax=Paenactinomyces guangxiensis TaxID=1490290 RepID=A0A7W1WQL2_9BACL|nr:NFACT RNA binding domain-containing protein [Paenactinomyces guangxiensis]MBA4494212.1 NFACT family protein [Paenactinomyces guangxiensis]MBH8590708.1 NFACT family protein [Paenactinomyces guangxiensis]
MSFDGIVTRAIVRELDQTCTGGRITKIYQPSDLELILHIRFRGQNHKLLLSAHPAYPRVQLTDTPADNPKEPPMFCMLLRKHGEGAIIQSIQQVGLERIIHLDFLTRNDLGDEVPRRLVIEIMGRHSNIILVNPETGAIFDGIRRVTHAISQYRQVLPGITYMAPPKQNKLNPMEVDPKTFIAGFDYNSGRLDKQIMNRFTGIGPLVAREIVHQAGLGSRERLWESFHDVITKVRLHQYQPSIIRSKGKSVFSVWPLTHLKGEIRTFASMSDCLETFFRGKAERDRVRQQTHDLIRKLKNEIEKNRKKIDILSKELAESERAEEYRIRGELLTAYLHQIRRGDQEVQVTNYYDPESPQLTIRLDPTLTPSENAQRYFKKYNKMKAAKKWNIEQIQRAGEENQYLESVLVQLENSSLREVEQIREELEEEGWLKARPQKHRRKKKGIPSPTTVYSSDGTIILVGRNNKQNDYLTHQLASPTDTWLHTKDIPGSHVVIRTRNVSETTLKEAAMLSAYFSKARDSSQVPVDFTLIKHVKKPSGARPGFVIYENQQTLFVTPDEEVIQELLNRKNLEE